jgi:hypothetical protein
MCYHSQRVRWRAFANLSISIQTSTYSSNFTTSSLAQEPTNLSIGIRNRPTSQDASSKDNWCGSLIPLPKATNSVVIIGSSMGVLYCHATLRCKPLGKRHKPRNSHGPWLGLFSSSATRRITTTQQCSSVATSEHCSLCIALLERYGGTTSTLLGFTGQPLTPLNRLTK